MSDTFKVQHLDHVALGVRDVAVSADWYRQVLGLERRYADAWEVPVVLGAGEGSIALFEGEPEAPGPGGTLHIGFAVDHARFAEARTALESHGLEPRFADHGICHSLYITDPDGYEIEITTYDLPKEHDSNG